MVLDGAGDVVNGTATIAEQIAATSQITFIAPEGGLTSLDIEVDGANHFSNFGGFSISVEPGDTPGVLLGDVNLDGAVTFLDIAPFIDILSTPGAFQAEADIDGSGQVTFLDISPFIDILAGG